MTEPPSAIGRFTTEDPARDGLNWYVYCNNNPIAFVDPTGYITEEEIAMYENGEMAPMAYTHLMNLTYQWYLSDNEMEKRYSINGQKNSEQTTT